MTFVILFSVFTHKRIQNQKMRRGHGNRGGRFNAAQKRKRASGGDSSKNDVRQIREHRALNNYFEHVNDGTDLDLDRLTGFKLDHGFAYDDPHEILGTGERIEFDHQRPQNEEQLEQFGKDAMSAIRAARPFGRIVWTTKGLDSSSMKAAAEQVTREADRPTFDPRLPLDNDLVSTYRPILSVIEDSEVYMACEQLSFVRFGTLPDELLPAPDPLKEPEFVYELASDISGVVRVGAGLHPLVVEPQPGLPASERVYSYRNDNVKGGPAFLFVLWLRQVALPVGTVLCNSRMSSASPPEESEREHNQRVLRRLVKQDRKETAEGQEEEKYRVTEEGMHGWYVARRHYVPITWRAHVPATTFPSPSSFSSCSSCNSSSEEEPAEEPEQCITREETTSGPVGGRRKTGAKKRRRKMKKKYTEAHT